MAIKVSDIISNNNLLVTGGTMLGSLILSPIVTLNPLEAISRQELHDTIDNLKLDDLFDVTITTPVNTNILAYNGSEWINRDLVKADITDFDDADYATAAQGLLADTALQPGDNVSELVNDAGYLTTAPVLSVNGHTGVVVLTYTDVGAAPLAHGHLIADVTGLQTALDSKVSKAGDTMDLGASITFTGGEILGLPQVPTTSTSATSKYYVDMLSQGLSWKQAVRAATLSNIVLFGTQVIDSVALAVNDRVLVKNQLNEPDNGIYLVKASTWQRASDMDATTPVNEINGAAVMVTDGVLNRNTGWTQNNIVDVLGTDDITWAQFSGSGTYLAGSGLTLTGNTFSISAPVTLTNGGTGLTNGGTANQLLGMNASASALEYKTLTAGTGINVTTVGNVITVENTGVTSVAFDDISSTPIYLVSGTPVTNTGTLAIALINQNANTVFAGPTAGLPAQPSFRALTQADLTNALQLYKENASILVSPDAIGTNSVAIGDSAKARLYGQRAYANGNFSAAGDAQHGVYILRNITTDDTVTQLYLDGVGGTQKLTIPQNSLMTFEITVAARRTDASGGGAGYKYVGVIKRDSSVSSTTFIDLPSETVIGETHLQWNVSLTIDALIGALNIEVTGEINKTIRWVATVQTTEVIN